MKSISNSEMSTFCKNFNNYHLHLKENPQSLIVRILGAFKLYWEADSMSIIIMENLCGINKKYVERAFDLKGSKYNRSVLTGEQIEDTTIRSKIFKDNDFMEMQQNLKVSKPDADKFMKKIEIDTEFLAKNNLIDYSMLIFIVNKTKYLKDHTEEEMNRNPGRNNAIIQAYNLPGLEYHVGIVDFLQPYNMQKFLEKNIKIAINMDTKIETSSQDPVYYKDRFQKFFRKICGLEP